MSITEVPVLPVRAGRHIAAWIVWHAVGVSLISDMPLQEAPVTRAHRRAA
jgi:hypothetical protein